MNSLVRISARKLTQLFRVLCEKIGHRTSISYDVAEQESTYSKAEIQNLSKGNTPDLPFKGVEVTEEEGIGNVKEGQMM